MEVEAGGQSSTAEPRRHLRNRRRRTQPRRVEGHNFIHIGIAFQNGREPFIQ
jgi:hypothetical protein